MHAAYWKYAVRRRLTGERRGYFHLKGSNWFVRPALDVDSSQIDAHWRGDRTLLEQEHCKLIETVRSRDPS